MKRISTFLLVFSLLFYSFAPSALALETIIEKSSTEVTEEKGDNSETSNENQTEVKEKDIESDETSEENKKQDTPVLESKQETKNIEPTLEKSKSYSLEDFEATGTLEIDINFVLPIVNVQNSNIGLKIKDKNNHQITLDFNNISVSTTKTYTLGDQSGELSIRKLDKTGNIISGIDEEKVMYYAVTIYNLKKGDYEVELYGNGYKTYNVSKVSLNDYSKRLSISNEKGLFEVGDVNRDGKVNDADIDTIIKNIDKKDTKSLEKYDLNRDGNIDIADIAMIAATINGQTKTLNLVDTSAIITSDTLSVEGIIEGNIQNLFQDNGTVTLKPENTNNDISESNAATINLGMKETKLMSQIRLETGLSNIPEEMDITVTDEQGQTKTIHKSFALNEDIHYFTDKANPNTIVIDLGGQIAVKKVTIKVTKTSGKNLVDIAKVEFLNNVYEEVPVPVIEVPKNVKVSAGSEQATVTYDNMPNVTGYEIVVQELNNGTVVKNRTCQTTYTTYEIKDLDNYTEYQVSVRAINGQWHSNYSSIVTFSPQPNRLPPAVDMVTLTPVTAGLNISYKKMKDTTSYNIYYREKDKGDYQKISDVKGTSYQLRDLKSDTEYQVYITGNNHLGEGSRSQIAVAKTKAKILPDTTNYKLINTSNGIGKVTNHIEHVEYKSNKYNASEFALVDNDYDTFWQSDSWDTGGFNNFNAGPIFNFDKAYNMDHLSFAPKDDTATFFYVKINYWDENNTSHQIDGSIKRLTSPNGETYYNVTFKPIKTMKIQVNLANYQASGNNAMRDFKFYEYDSLEDDVAALFADDLRVELKENVTLEKIEALEKRANTKDKVSGEYHPKQKTILSDLNYAKDILTDKALQDTIIVDQNVSNAKNSHLGFAMSLSDLQPLGIAAQAGDTITVYIGTKSSTLPQLVFTQYQAEANVWKQSVVNLKKGQNIIDVPKIGSTSTERGGSVYLRYPSAKSSDNEIKVRVSGGTKIPVLDIHNITDQKEIKTKIATYIKELKTFTGKLPDMYDKEGEEFDARTSVLNSTEIVTKNGLLSVAATAAYNGIKNNLDEEGQIDRLYNSVTAFEEMMNLFYRQKGLSENPSDARDKLPSSRINIRYMRMFDGAFMYAGGEHIGIGYGSISGLMQGRPNKVENNDVTTSGFFGWGISHEIGHQINQGKLAYAEVTNNIYSLLAQTNDDKQKARIEGMYDQIYEKVTSNTVGKASNVFVSLGMYWQLHLAYDDIRTFDDTNSIYARINHLSRTSSLTGSKDDLLVMYASEAAGKDLTEFFEKWGITPSDEAKAYAAKYEKEQRPIWYLNDDARRYRLNKGSQMAPGTLVNARITEGDSQNKRYTLSFDVDKNPEAILGYEIKRNGTPIMFTTSNTFTDVIGSMNNQAITYEVTAYDKYLNHTKTYTLDEVKVNHDGSINKNAFSISSNFKNESDEFDYENPDMNLKDLSVNKLIDSHSETIFNGNQRITSTDKTTPNIIIDLNSKMDVAGFKYSAATKDGKLLENTINKYKVYVSKDRENWTLAKTGNFKLNEDNNYTNIIYFDKEGTTGGDQLWTYSDISYVKLEAIGNSGISGSEIDIIAPPGDNVDASADTVGVLEKDYHYLDGEGKDATIKAGTVIFKGDYRGNPAFNVILLVDADNPDTVFNGENFLFAKLNSDAEVNEIAKGYWFYTVTKEQYAEMQNKNIRAELYRVNDPVTNEGQRLTSTSLKISHLKAYDELPKMEIVDSTKGE